ncbi:formate/nitrite transporter family protein [Cloacibacillus sp.]
MSYKIPAEIASAAVDSAIKKSRLPLLSMVVLGFLAGSYIAMGGYFMTVVTQDASGFVGLGISKLLGGIVFALGLLLVIAAGGELFTGNCIMPIAILSGKVSWAAAARNLIVMYISNLVGGIFFAWILYLSGTITPSCAQTALSIAVAKVNIPLGEMIIRGILCNWFVALAVWIAFGALDMSGKYIACLMLISAFVAMGFEHCVANMYFISLGLFLKNDAAVMTQCQLPAEKLMNLTPLGYWRNLIPVTFGNMIGAAVLVGVLYYIVFKKGLSKDI